MTENIILDGKIINPIVMERPHCILPQLWLGPAELCMSALVQGMFTIDVGLEPCSKACSWYPFMATDQMIQELSFASGGVVDLQCGMDVLEAFAEVFREEYILKGRAVYVHCKYGVEHAPFALAYALHKHMFPLRLFEKSYSFVKQQRPSVVDRSQWLEELKRGRERTREEARTVGSDHPDGNAGRGNGYDDSKAVGGEGTPQRAN